MHSRKGKGRGEQKTASFWDWVNIAHGSGFPVDEEQCFVHSSQLCLPYTKNTCLQEGPRADTSSLRNRKELIWKSVFSLKHMYPRDGGKQAKFMFSVTSFSEGGAQMAFSPFCRKIFEMSCSDASAHNSQPTFWPAVVSVSLGSLLPEL